MLSKTVIIAITALKQASLALTAEEKNEARFATK